MTSEQQPHPIHDDPLGLNRRLRRALSSTAIPVDIVDTEKLNSEARDALLRVAEALGECRLFEVEVDESLDGTLPLGVALVVVEEATQVAAAIKKAVEILADPQPDSLPIDPLERDADEIEAGEDAIQLVERRLALVAVREVTEEAYYAAEVDSETLRRLEKKLQEDLDASEALDEAMVRNIQRLLPVRQTNLLRNWQAFLRESYRPMAQHWWFFDEALWQRAEAAAPEAAMPIRVAIPWPDTAAASAQATYWPHIQVTIGNYHLELADGHTVGALTIFRLVNLGSPLSLPGVQIELFDVSGQVFSPINSSENGFTPGDMLQFENLPINAQAIRYLLAKLLPEH